MRKIIIQAEISLDGIIEGPERWVFPYHNEAITNYFGELFAASDALIMGRLTYEGFAEFWPGRAGADEFSDRINSLPKYVASRTLQAPLKWNANLLGTNLVEEVAALKQQAGQNIMQYGVGELSHTLLKAGLIDEIHLFVYPVMIGSGARIFENIEQSSLKLLDMKHHDTGVVTLVYQPEKQG